MVYRQQQQMTSRAAGGVVHPPSTASAIENNRTKMTHEELEKCLSGRNEACEIIV